MDTLVAELFGLIVAGVIYFIPSLIALLRDKAYPGATIIINLLFGWTGLGWLIALIMAFAGPNKRDYAILHGAGPEEQELRLGRLADGAGVASASAPGPASRTARPVDGTPILVMFLALTLVVLLYAVWNGADCLYSGYTYVCGVSNTGWTGVGNVLGVTMITLFIWEALGLFAQPAFVSTRLRHALAMALGVATAALTLDRIMGNLNGVTPAGCMALFGSRVCRRPPWIEQTVGQRCGGSDNRVDQTNGRPPFPLKARTATERPYAKTGLMRGQESRLFNRI